jgi:SAM-dependent methyltransferase
MEGYGPSTYGDGFADVYDDWYGDVSNVEATVARVAELVDAAGGGAVLELGCGTGRLAIPLAAAGLTTWGIDASPAMIGRLRAKPGGGAVAAAVGDMSELDLGDAPPFAVVLCAFNTLFNLTSSEAQRRCLSRVAERLAPKGRLLVEAFVPPPLDEDDDSVGSIEPWRIGLDEVVLSVSRLDPTTRTVVGQHVQLSEGGVRLRPWMLHYATPHELDDLAQSAGLRLLARDGGWRGEPFTAGSDRHVSTYGRR